MPFAACNFGAPGSGGGGEEEQFDATEAGAMARDAHPNDLAASQMRFGKTSKLEILHRCRHVGITLAICFTRIYPATLELSFRGIIDSFKPQTCLGTSAASSIWVHGA